MHEVAITIRFNQHSLGDCRYKNISRMLRDPNGRVMFMPSWWLALMRYAAQVLNRHHDVVKDIDWDPVVEGTTSEYRRFYAPGKYTIHEAYLPGDSVTIHAVIPSALPVDDFLELLRIAGQYKGISPYRKDKQYGTFEVLSVEKLEPKAPGSA